MKKKLICLVLVLVMMLSSVAVLTSCGDETCESHVDKNNDKKCDVCGEPVKGEETKCEHKDEDEDEVCDLCGQDLSEEEEVIDYPWEKTDILFQMTHCTDQQQLPSGCERYLAGEDLEANEPIDTMVAERNSEAYYLTKVNVKYDYWQDNVQQYSWGEAIEVIYNNTHSGTTKDNPDIYCDFVYDIVGASLKGCFANLRSTTKGDNYFEFNDKDYNELEDNRGYMYDYMENTTLSKHKMYVIASDYFLDLIRAYFITPVNVAMLESVGMEVTGDRNGDGKFSIDDFYDQVADREWNYDLAAAYSEAIYEPAATNTTGGKSIDDTLGWGIGYGGLAGSGVLYTTNITIINKVWNDEKNDYDYWYPSDSDESISNGLYTLCDNLRDLMTKPGVMAIVTDSRYGANDGLTVRTRFCDNKILFGGVMLVGALEQEPYQKLKDASGFGVVPVPLYHEVDTSITDPEDPDYETYLTAIHNNGRCGAIAVCTQNFSQISAFLNYQSTHSTEILNEYYDFKLQYQVADGSKGTVKMLQLIRSNVRSNFDKTWEDAIGMFYEDETNRWHYIICAQYKYSVDMRGHYGELYESKQERLKNLIKEYDVLPE